MAALATTLHEKVWGSFHTEPWFKNPEGRKIGEIWFSASPDFPLLVKLLFTSDRMSVQVHPDDDYARLHENSPGKTEMWHVLHAEPDAQVALGMLDRIDKRRLREGAVSGEIEGWLNWMPARQGDTFFIPAGTIHAIGKGLVMCEVQQKSDVTYRLYDYGRPRELHLDKAMEVSSVDPWTPQPADCKYFSTEIHEVEGRLCFPSAPGSALYVALEGEGEINGESFQPGQAFETAEAVEFRCQRGRILRTAPPGRS